jgi:hypothetical protein
MVVGRRVGFYLSGIASLLFLACASKVLVPPRIDLTSYGTIGMIEFTSKSPGGLGHRASQDFVAAIHAAQPGVPILELGKKRRVLRSVERDVLDPEAIRAIGEKYRVDAIIVGDLDVERVRPRFSVNSLMESASAGAYIEGSLGARIFQARSGATIWTNAARGQEAIAHVNVRNRGLPRLGATDPEGAQGRLVRRLVGRVTADFWPHYEND